MISISAKKERERYTYLMQIRYECLALFMPRIRPNTFKPSRMLSKCNGFILFFYSRNPSNQATSCCVYPLSPTLSALPETRHVLASVKAKEIAQQQSKRGKIKEKMRNKEKKGERRTPKADDSRNFDADDDAVILANTNTIYYIYPCGWGNVTLSSCFQLRI